MEFWGKRMNQVPLRSEGREFVKNKESLGEYIIPLWYKFLKKQSLCPRPVGLSGLALTSRKKSLIYKLRVPGAVLLYLEVILCFQVLKFFFFFKYTALCLYAGGLPNFEQVSEAILKVKCTF